MEKHDLSLKGIKFCQFCCSEKNLNDLSDDILFHSQLLQIPTIEFFGRNKMPQMVCTPCQTFIKKMYQFIQMTKLAKEQLNIYRSTAEKPRKLNYRNIPITQNDLINKSMVKQISWSNENDVIFSSTAISQQMSLECNESKSIASNALKCDVCDHITQNDQEFEKHRSTHEEAQNVKNMKKPPKKLSKENRKENVESYALQLTNSTINHSNAPNSILPNFQSNSKSVSFKNQSLNTNDTNFLFFDNLDPLLSNNFKIHSNGNIYVTIIQEKPTEK